MRLENNTTSLKDKIADLKEVFVVPGIPVLLLLVRPQKGRGILLQETLVYQKLPPYVRESVEYSDTNIMIPNNQINQSRN